MPLINATSPASRFLTAEEPCGPLHDAGVFRDGARSARACVRGAKCGVLRVAGQEGVRVCACVRATLELLARHRRFPDNSVSKFSLFLTVLLTFANV